MIVLASLLVASALASSPAAIPQGIAAAPQGASQPQPAEVVAEITVHGNVLTSDEDVKRIAGVVVGDPFAPETVGDVEARLRASKRFVEVRVLERYASIADPSKILLVIIVNEGPVRIDVPKSGAPIRVVKRRVWSNLMWLPILDAEDGYGLTYGARVAYVGTGRRPGRLSMPFSWGGMKQAGVEFDQPFAQGPVDRVTAGAAVTRQTNPAFKEDDSRRRVWARAERAAGPFLAGATAGVDHVSFAGATDTLHSVGADLTYDTRLDRLLPRNAVYGVASWQRIGFGSGGVANRLRLEGHGYIGLFGQTVLAIGAVREDADRPLPPYLKSLLGGGSSLRGFSAGAFAGDTAMFGSLELRVPLTSPLQLGKVGVSVFVDAGAAYDKPQRWRDQPVRRGVGASLWFAAAVFHLDVSVAHGVGAGTRVRVGGGLTVF